MTYFKEIGQECEIVVSHAPKIPPQGWRGYWTLVLLGQTFPRANLPTHTEDGHAHRSEVVVFSFRTAFCLRLPAHSRMLSLV